MTENIVELIGPLAVHFFGEPNKGLSSRKELRFGSRGSLAVDLEKGTWFDHEANEGGGVLALVRREKGFSEDRECFEWMETDGFWANTRTSKANGAHPRVGREVAHYDYVDEAGNHLFQVVKFEPKDFRQRRRDEGQPSGWAWSVKGVRHVPYRLPDLIEALANDHTVYVVEGEKDADAMWERGQPATTNAGGAGKWREELNQFFSGADVVVIADNDPQAENKLTGEPLFHEDGRPKLPGQDHANNVASKLAKVASKVRVLDLGKHWSACPPKGDISDFFEAGNTVEQLIEIVAKLPNWTLREKQAADPWWRDATDIPPREALYGKHFMRCAIGATIGAGGRAKTTQGTYEAISMAVGFDLTTREILPKGPLRVWFINAEEDKNELDRRFAATCLRHNVSREALGGRLFVESVSENPMRLATLVGGNPTLNQAALGQMRDFITRNHIDVFMIDPFISFHTVNESTNADMDLLIKGGLSAIAKATNSAGEIFHHPGKPKPGQDTTVEDGRGASAIIYAVRSARVFNFMTPAEATKLGIPEEERRLHIRISNGKANMAPIGKAHWIKIGVENLPNGDEVACASLWTPPNPFDGVTSADVELARELAQTGAHRADSRSSDWFGYPLASHLKIDVRPGRDNAPEDLARLKAIIKIWLKNNVLAIEEREDEYRKKRQFIVCGDFKQQRPEGEDSDEDSAL